MGELRSFPHGRQASFLLKKIPSGFLEPTGDFYEEVERVGESF